MKVVVIFASVLMTSCYASLLRNNIPENVKYVNVLLFSIHINLKSNKISFSMNFKAIKTYYFRNQIGKKTRSDNGLTIIH